MKLERRVMGVILVILIAAGVAYGVYLRKLALRDQYLSQCGSLENRVSVFFGYKDTRPARFVGDRYEEALWIEWLLAQGFEPVHASGGSGSDWAQTFQKKVQVRDGLESIWRVRVISSSLSADDLDNVRNRWQKQWSQKVEELFLQALVEEDAVFYDGHSRKGGGPDFFHDGGEKLFQKMLRALSAQKKGSGGRIQKLGLFSCASSEHFQAELRGALPRLKVWGTGELIYFEKALSEMKKELLRAMESEKKCQPRW
jgi:hypothetical protein